MKTIRFILFFIFVFFLVTPVRGGETIDIAAIYALTGPAADANALTLQGVDYAVDEINKEGGVSGRKINLSVLDNQSTPICRHRGTGLEFSFDCCRQCGPGHRDSHDLKFVHQS
jgi:hypothetical protein